MALVKFAVLGLCVFLCLRLTSANTNGASSRSINGGGEDDDDRFSKMSFANANRASSKSINGGGDDDGDDDDRFPKMSFANTNKASSKSINVGGGDNPRSRKMMPSSGSFKHPLSGSAHLRGKGFGFGFGYDCSMPGACQNPNRPVTVEYPCPAYGSICNRSPCYPDPPSYGCQPCNQQAYMAHKVNMKNGAQNSPKAATETMPGGPHQ